MPLSQRQAKHLKRINDLPQVKVGRFQKGINTYTERICQFCGRSFTVLTSQLKRGRGTYCSKNCFFRAKIKYGNRDQIVALYQQGKTYKEIGEELGIVPATVGGQIYRMKLADRYGDGVTAPAGHKDGLKNILKKHYGIEQCELCGYSRAVEIAHIIEKRNGGHFIVSNCILLCPNCHYLFDCQMLTDTEKGKLLKINRLNGSLKGRLYESL